MLKLYCQKCGALNAYVSEKPNFCQKCGNNFSGEQQQVPPAASTAKETSTSIEASDDVESSTNAFNINQLSALDVEMDSGRTSTDSLGNIVGTAKSGQMDNFNAPKGQTSYTMEDFKREAGFARSKHEPEET